MENQIISKENEEFTEKPMENQINKDEYANLNKLLFENQTNDNKDGEQSESDTNPQNHDTQTFGIKQWLQEWGKRQVERQEAHYQKIFSEISELNSSVQELNKTLKTRQEILGNTLQQQDTRITNLINPFYTIKNTDVTQNVRPPTYSGDDDRTNPVKFLQDFDKYCRQLNIQEEEKFTHVLQFLEGPAKIWAEVHKNSWRNFRDFRNNFLTEARKPLKKHSTIAKQPRQRKNNPKSQYVVNWQSRQIRSRPYNFPQATREHQRQNKHIKYTPIRDKLETNNEKQEIILIKIEPEAVVIKEEPEDIVHIKEDQLEVVIIKEEPEEIVIIKEEPKEIVIIKEEPQEIVNIQEEPHETVNIQEELQETVNIQEELQETVNIEEEPQDTVNIYEEPQETVNIQEELQETVNI